MAKRFVSVWFPHLITDWFVIANPALRGKVFVVRTTSHNRMVVAAAPPAAQALGIVSGMSLADARALYPGLLLFDEKPALEENLLKRLALWAVRFTPVAAADHPSGLFLDASGCAHLWGGEEAYLKEIERRLQERGYHIRLAMAGSPGAAWAVARYGKEQPIVRNGEEGPALLSLSVASLRLDDETVQRLQKLGLRRIEHLLHLPRPSLRRRFGEEILRRLDQAFGREEECLRPVHPVEPYQERLPCLEPIITHTGIAIALQQVLERMCNRLQREGKGLRTAIFRAYQINGGIAQVVIGTSGLSNHAAHLYKLFEIKLSIIQPESGIELFVLEAKGVDTYVPKQEAIWEGTPSAMDRQIAELLDRIVIKFGRQCVSRFLPQEHYWPERSLRAAPSLEETTEANWREDRPRPVLLLKKPQPVDVAAPVPDYPPMHFRYKGTLHKIIAADGPERIEQEWWIEEGEHRDYYLVEDEGGNRYWLFRLGHYSPERTVGWFLHGFFA